jgi:uncharacterized protein
MIPYSDFSKLMIILYCSCFLLNCEQYNNIIEERNLVSAATTHENKINIESEKKEIPVSSSIVNAARWQIGKTISYDPSYQKLNYPGGDVPIKQGVCTDVIIRALRVSIGLDLQKLVHEDMNKAFHEYPEIWGLKRTDSNIDHRRVPNLQCYFKRAGYAIGISKNNNDYKPGDFVTCTVPPHLPHIMIVSERKNRNGVPFVIHNIGSGTKEEDRLFDFPHTGHYRIIGF